MSIRGRNNRKDQWRGGNEKKINSNSSKNNSRFGSNHDNGCKTKERMKTDERKEKEKTESTKESSIQTLFWSIEGVGEKRNPAIEEELKLMQRS